MSHYDKPRLSERLRGKSGEELINEMKKEFENNKKNWFGSDIHAGFGSPRKNEFPFDDDPFIKKSDAGIKSHLEDLAKKHPEFAYDLRCPPWGGSVEKNWENAFNIPVSVEKSEVDGHKESASHPSASHKESDIQSKERDILNRQDLKNSARRASVEKNWENAFNIPVSVGKGKVDGQQESGDTLSKEKDNLNQHGLRNTVDIVEQVQRANQKPDEEPKRSCSAPPISVTQSKEQSEMNKQEPKRFTSKIEITPINPFEENGSVIQEEKSNDENKSASNVRHIPIKSTNASNSEIESPRLNRRNISATSTREIPIITEKNQSRSEYESPQTNRKQYESPQMNRKQPQVRHIPIFVEGRKDPVVSKHIDEQPEQSKQFQQEQTPLKRKFDSNGNNGLSCGKGPTKQTQPSSQEKEVPAKTTNPSPPPPPPPKPVDPMQRIQDIQKEVENLANKVEQYSGNARTDKEYLYLDEMLTRNLIKLDTIEVEGNENLRTARKNVIKCIQKSIALLENKVPLTNASASNDTDVTSQENINEVPSEPSEEPTKEIMEIDNNESNKEQKTNGTEIGNNTKCEKSEAK